jgi:hypothetical protein
MTLEVLHPGIGLREHELTGDVVGIAEVRPVPRGTSLGEARTTDTQ